MSKREKPITAEELHRQLESDPEWVAREAAREAEARRGDEAERFETRELISDLAAVGIRVRSIWTLVNTRERYPEAIPVLITHLQRPYCDRTKEGIARALTVTEARGVAAQALIDEFRKLPAPVDINGAKWAMGNALSLVATKEHAQQLVELVCDKRYGGARSMLPLALGKFRTPEVKAALELLVDDPDVALQVKRALKKFERLSRPGRKSPT
jgi:HEAT repeat protein